MLLEWLQKEQFHHTVPLDHLVSAMVLSGLQYVLARIFGTNDALFSRDDEQRIFSQVAEVGLGPKLLVRI